MPTRKWNMICTGAHTDTVFSAAFQPANADRLASALRRLGAALADADEPSKRWSERTWRAVLARVGRGLRRRGADRDVLVAWAARDMEHGDRRAAPSDQLHDGQRVGEARGAALLRGLGARRQDPRRRLARQRVPRRARRRHRRPPAEAPGGMLRRAFCPAAWGARVLVPTAPSRRSSAATTARVRRRTRPPCRPRSRGTRSAHSGGVVAAARAPLLSGSGGYRSAVGHARAGGDGGEGAQRAHAQRARAALAQGARVARDERRVGRHDPTMGHADVRVRPRDRRAPRRHLLFGLPPGAPVCAALDLARHDGTHVVPRRRRHAAAAPRPPRRRGGHGAGVPGDGAAEAGGSACVAPARVGSRKR